MIISMNSIRLYLFGNYLEIYKCIAIATLAMVIMITIKEQDNIALCISIGEKWELQQCYTKLATDHEYDKSLWYAK